MPCFQSSDFPLNSFMRLQELRGQWDTFERVFQASAFLSTQAAIAGRPGSANYQYSSLSEKNDARDGQSLHVKVYPTSNWVLPTLR